MMTVGGRCDIIASNKSETERKMQRMLNNQAFDLWADGYDKSVALAEENDEYPFAGYKKILNTIYNHVLAQAGKCILDIGFGTGTLTTKLYQQGCIIYGQDFSNRMIKLAQEKMPEAHLYQGDFTFGLVKKLAEHQYDSIIATYSLHHLSDTQKVGFLNNLLELLKPNGCIYIGDVAFHTRHELETCCHRMAEMWDEDEIYFVFDELKHAFPQMEFEQISYCSGILYLKR